ncbi:hypothetical protein Ade02nite_23570 [Paractinoplanes deccanensis]|uniref:N-acetyltransferase domain-containing protein n=1 Tax=Paractinoplanes deccanensis TaxID=113561 RepID=A0ABQ3Y135_9ACTN|nr:GNAT family N-acetyltransferase [Actinoplanes deccanensis]GID73716.1 hypothetical protein Ade02nite_23570 [Actinoplanes deccanensis]
MTDSTGTREMAVRQAAARDLEPVIKLMATAFTYSIHGPWLISDEHARHQVLHRFFRIIVPHAMVHAQVDVIGAGQAAAIWYRLDGTQGPRIPGFKSRLAEATGEHLGRFVELAKTRAAHHPSGRHDHLAYLAVQPGSRRQGLGSQLLDHHHRLLDRKGRHAFVEATTNADSLLFARHGYDPIDLYVPGSGGPPLYQMWRHSRR